MKLIRLCLQGPLQSWGERSRWDSRDTASMPTKSGIIGLLGCCMGIPRGSDRLRELNRALHIAVRADKPGRIMTDFHTVQAPDGQRMLNSQGKPRGETILTPKQYLQEAVFTVFIWGDEDVLETACDALQHPVWTPYLGRRSCVPSVPLLPVMVEAETVDEAVAMDAPQDVMVEIEKLPGDALRADERLLQRPDSLINASVNEYQFRAVRAATLHREG